MNVAHQIYISLVTPTASNDTPTLGQISLQGPVAPEKPISRTRRLRTQKSASHSNKREALNKKSRLAAITELVYDEEEG
jgi:hypothetical protein